MNFSVLLPTRNGGPYLKDCIESILNGLPDDSELIISDNANIDETAEVISIYLKHPRIKVCRSDEILSVTDNWNNALKAAEGKYVLMMGDDDLLLPGYFDCMLEAINRFDNPDCILYNAYGYIAPGSMSNSSLSYYREEIFKFDHHFLQERELEKDERKKILLNMFKFKVGIPLNMQTILVKRSIFESIGGKFLPPFPDHYALNAMLLEAKKWVYVPLKPVIVGMSPKSFGHFVYSNQQGSGLNYLGINPKFDGRLPGNELLNGMHVWLQMLKENFPELNHVSIDRRQYVRRQVYAWLLQFRLSSINLHQLFSNLRLLGIKDWLGLMLSIFDSKSWIRFLKMGMISNRESAQVSQVKALTNIGTIQEFANWLSRGNGT